MGRERDEEVERRMSLLIALIGVDADRPPPPPPAKDIDRGELERRLTLLEERFGKRR